MLPADEMLAAAGAGCAATLVGHPLDTLKVHLQTQPHLSTTFRAAQSLFHAGPCVFMRGIGPPLCNAVLMNTVMFGVFNRLKHSSGLSYVAGETASSLVAGLVSGCAIACIGTPMDFVKIHAQLHGGRSLTILSHALRRHPRALLRGHTANLGREGIFTMVYLGLYDCGRRQNADAGLLWVAATSSVTGALAWVTSYPCDTVKSVLQGSKEDMSVRDGVRELWSRGGISAFYRGCLASTGRAMLVTSTRMLGYEWIMGLLSKPWAATSS